VICPIRKVTLKDRIKFSFIKGHVYEFYFFPRGEELWFGLTRFPSYVSVTTIETAAMQSADLAISERETQQLSKKGSPCQKYESKSSSQIGFVECGSKAISSFLKSRINCSIPGLSMFLSNLDEIPECQDKLSAKRSYLQFVSELMYDFLAKPSDFGCPLPCTQTSYNLDIKYFHKTAYLDVADQVILCSYNAQRFFLKVQLVIWAF